MTPAELETLARTLNCAGIFTHPAGPHRVPGEFFDTYSAMANTTGGRIALCVYTRATDPPSREREEIERIETELRTHLAEGLQFSVDLISREGIRRVEFNGHPCLQIDVPAAPAEVLPVHAHHPYHALFRTFVRMNGVNHRVGSLLDASLGARANHEPARPPSLSFPRFRTSLPPDELDPLRRLLDALDLHINACIDILRGRDAAPDEHSQQRDVASTRLADLRAVRAAVLHGLFTGRFQSPRAA